MSNEHDGSIIIDTELDDTGFAKGSKRMLGALKSLTRTAKDIGGKIRTTASQAASSILSMSSAAQKEAASMSGSMSHSLEQYERELAKVEKQIEATEMKLQQFHAEVAQINENTNESLKFAETEAQVNRVLEMEQIQINGVNRKYASQLSLLDQLRQKQAELQTQISALKAQHSSLQARQSSTIRSMISNIRRYVSETRKASIANNRLIRGLTSLKTLLISRIKHLFISEIMNQVTSSLEVLRKYSGQYDRAVKRIKEATARAGANVAIAIAHLVITAEPYIVRLINLLTKALEKLNKFFATLRGVKNTQVDAIIDYGDAIDAAADAQKKLNAELYSFDELNRQSKPEENEQEQTGMVPVFGEGDVESSSFLDGLLEKLGSLKGLAIGIGAAIAAWKLGKPLLALSKLGGEAVRTLAGVALGLGGATAYTIGFVDAIKNGLSKSNLIEMLAGGTAAAVGLGLAFGKAKAGLIGLAVGGVGALVLGAREWIRTGELTTQSFAAIEGGVIALGIGLSSLTGGWSLLIAGVAAAALAIYQYWDQISGWLVGVKDAIGAWFASLYWTISEWWAGTVEPAIAAAIDWIVQGFVDLGTELGFLWQQTLTLATTIGGAIRDFFVAAVNTIRTTAQVVATMVKQHWEQLKATTTAIWTAIKTTVVVTANTIKSTLTSTITAAKNAVVAQWNALLASCKAIFTAIHTHVTSTIQSLTSFLSGTSWYGLGVNLMQGFLNGLRSLMSTIWNEVVEFVRRCTEAVRNALHIGSPSKVFEEIGRFTGEGFIIGIQGEQDAAIKTVKNLAGAVTDEMSGAVGNIDVSASGMDAIIARLSKTADIFKTIASTLSTIGGFSQPQISAGTVVPYKTQVDTSGTTENAKEEVATVLGELLAAVRGLSSQNDETPREVHYHIVADGKEIFDLVVMENDRAINRTGASPLRV